MTALRSPTGKPITLPPIHPNQGIEAAYRKKLTKLVDELHNSVVYWVEATYKANPPLMAQDATDVSGHWTDGMSAAASMREALAKLARRRMKKINDLAPFMARWFATAAIDRSDAAMKAALKKSGFAIEWKMTREANEVMQATIGEQVGLIKSIASQHLAEVDGLVMRSVAQGGNLAELSKELQKRYGVTRRRAELIARDQNNKATSTITIVRQSQLGIKQAKWLHSHAGKHPRPEHVAANGKIYDVDKGMFLEGKWTYPGREINCRCVSRSILPG
jgi:SPP1 gp7 family putative phage head morphogenesis protein